MNLLLYRGTGVLFWILKGHKFITHTFNTQTTQTKLHDIEIQKEDKKIYQTVTFFYFACHPLLFPFFFRITTFFFVGPIIL